MKELKLKITMSNHAFKHFKKYLKSRYTNLNLSKIVLWENSTSPGWIGDEVFFDCKITEVKANKNKNNYKKMKLSTGQVKDE